MQDAAKPGQVAEVRPWQEAAAPPIAELCGALEPRYHLFGTADLFYQRPPFKEQFPHNENLQQQFASLATSFQAWRPIRGDGLRQLVANYVRVHAKDPIATGTGPANASNGLTLESWALAISGAVNIEEYCHQHISSMQKD
eukprot:Skav218612  [mRNA]  locus=scaffold3208:75427:84213:+ [translate_table: standard]